MMDGWGWDAGGWAWWMWLMMALVFTVFWGLVVVAVVAVARSFSRPHDRVSHSAGAAEAILRERFARGEIDEDEFRSRLGALREGNREGT